jgi:cold shock protein
MNGYVRKIFLEKGFAFVEGEDERDYFLHWSKVSRNSVPFRNIKENDKVTFDFEEGTNGPKAFNVLVIRERATDRVEEKPNARSDTIDPGQSEPVDTVASQDEAR